jgi:hypothetical protein
MPCTAPRLLCELCRVILTLEKRHTDREICRKLRLTARQLGDVRQLIRAFPCTQ